MKKIYEFTPYNQTEKSVIFKTLSKVKKYVRINKIEGFIEVYYKGNKEVIETLYTSDF